MKIQTQQQQQQTGWAMNGRTTPRSAVMDTFRWNAGGGGGGLGGDVVIRNETKQPRPDKKDALHKIFTRLHVTYGFYGLCIN